MRTIALLIFLMAPSLARADLRIDPPVLDLGGIRGGPAAECVFQLINDGPATVELVDLERSCGCIEPRWSSRSLKSGEKATLSLRLRTLGQPEGPRLWPLILVTRQLDKIIKLDLAIKGTVRNEITLQPPQVAIFVTKALEQEITLVDRRDRPLTVTSWDAKMPGVRIDKLASPPGTTRLKLTVDGTQLPVGRRDHVLHLYTNDLIYDHLEASVTLVRLVEPKVSWSPETPEVILAPGQNKATAMIRVVPRDGAPLAVDKAEANDAGVSVAFHAGEDAVMVRVAVDRAAFVRGLQTSVRLTAGGEVIAIPVLVRIE